MSRSSKVVVLCEDKRTQKLIRSFLRKLSYRNHELRFTKINAGSAEQQVREQFPNEVAYLRNSRFQDQVLIAAIDADNFTVEERLRQLEQSLGSASLPARDPEEKICLLIPRRNIETWIRVLSGDEVSEEENCKPPPGGTQAQRLDNRSAQAGERFYELTRPNAPLPNPTVDSLNRAIPEARRVPKASA
ncbi:MAG: hypothetical protein KJZ70_07865 [Bryobacterales bacterium]|nr:hypothetical protein [Bryobacterales bacterium]